MKQVEKYKDKERRRTIKENKETRTDKEEKTMIKKQRYTKEGKNEGHRK